MKVEFSLGEINSFTLGIYIAQGGDENGEFNMPVLGFGLFDITFYKYY